MFLLVIVRPNSAFATIRDNADRYFWWSLGGFGLITIVYYTMTFLSRGAVINDGSSVLAYILALSPPFLCLLIISWLISRQENGIGHWKVAFSTLGYVWTIFTILGFSIALIVGHIISIELESLDNDVPLLPPYMYEEAPPTRNSILNKFVPMQGLFLGVIIYSVFLMIKTIKVITNGSGTKMAAFVAILGFIIMWIMSPTTNII